MLQKDLIILLYCLVDDLLKSKGHYFDKRTKLSDSELITIALVAALSFGGVWQSTLTFFKEYGFCTQQICKSRLSRRMSRLDPLIDELISSIGSIYTELSAEKAFILDSAPFSVCDNIRIPRCKILQGEQFRGYVASFKRYFYGLRLQLLTTKDGVPVSYAITEGQLNDISALQQIPFAISAESTVYADAGYTDYQFEDNIKQQKNILLLVQRKKNSKRQRPVIVEQMIKKHRKRIETVFSQIKEMLKRKIHAVTIETFILKIKCFILAFQLKKLI